MKVLVISGFLGAGKTTFIKELANRTGRDIAIFENEYAAEGVDKTILEDGITNGSVNITELSEGCICCSTKGDFKASVLTIANSVDPEILIVEPTGVGMLSNVIANIQEIEYERIKLLPPVTIVDGKSIDRYASEYNELFEDQVKGASVIVVSKLENADASEKEHVKDILRKINGDSEIITDHYTTLDDAWFDALYSGQAPEDIKDAGVLTENLPETFTIEGISIPDVTYLIGFLDNLIRGEFGNIIRVKGHTVVNGEYVRFEVADRTYYISGVSGEHSSTAVFIGHDIRRQEIRKKLFKSHASSSRFVIKPGVSKLFAGRTK